MNIQDKQLLHTLSHFIILTFINYEFDISKTLLINKSSYIQDYIIGLLFLSFIIYCIIYYGNIILKNDNSNPYMSIWNQINVNGSLFIIVTALYFKIMPMKIITIILLLVILIIFYPLNEYVENYILNESFTPNMNDCLKAIDYSSRNVFDINDVTKIKYYIGLNELDPTEIIINFKGTNPNEEKNILSNLNINFTSYPKELITNSEIINN